MQQSFNFDVAHEPVRQERSTAADTGGFGAFRHMASVTSGEWSGVDVQRAAREARSVRNLDREPGWTAAPGRRPRAMPSGRPQAA